MSNVDKDLDYMISPQEFYTLLSQKFEKDDPKDETCQSIIRRDSDFMGLPPHDLSDNLFMLKESMKIALRSSTTH